MQNKFYIGSAVDLGKVFPDLLPDGHSVDEGTLLWS
jgi:hypothetical protein